MVEQWIDRLMLGGAEDVPDWQGRVEGSQEGGFVLTLTVAGQARTIADADCGRLAVAAALVVAVATDPLAVADVIEAPLHPPEPAPPLLEEPLEPPPAPLEEPPGAPPSRAAPPRRGPAPDLLGLVSAGIGAELAVLPRPGFAATLGAGVLWSRLRVELVGVLSVPRNIETPEPDFGARAAVAAGQVRGCWVVRAPPMEVPLCLAGELGGVWARGFGPSIEPQPRIQRWVAAVPSLGVTGWLSKRVGLEARISVPLGLYKPAVHLSGVDLDVFRAGSVGARLWVGPVVRFP